MRCLSEGLMGLPLVADWVDFPWFVHLLGGTLSRVAAEIHVPEGHAATIPPVATIMLVYAKVCTLWLHPLSRDEKAVRRPAPRSR